MITPPASRVAFSLFGINVMWYGILIALGIFLGSALSSKEAERYGISEDDFTSMILWIIPMAVIGARLYYVIFSWEYYAQDLVQIINVRGGGLAIHGGILAGVLTAYLYTRKKKMSFLRMADAAAPGLALGQAIGRWGNFFNQEAYGGPTNLPWGMWINGTTVHPTFLYESVGTLLLCGFLLWYSRHKRRQPGEVLFWYMIVYGALRFMIEGLRTDSLYFMGFRIAQIISVAAFLGGILGLALWKRKENQIGSKLQKEKTRRNR